MILNMTITGTSSTKSIIIVSIDSGSTVAAYSDATYTTLVKDAVEKSNGEFWITNLDNGTYYLKATKDTNTSTLTYTITEYGVYRISMGYRTIPEFIYIGGDYEVVTDDDIIISDVTTYNETNWKIRFLTSGTLIFSKLNGAADGIDVFLVGGGGGGAGSIYNKADTSYHALARGGGGGGYTTTGTTTVTINQDYVITIGQGGTAGDGGHYNSPEAVAGGDGGTTVFYNLTAPGGSGAPGDNYGGDGGSGGGGMNGGYSAGSNGGSDGSDGGSSHPGTGQGTTTREFGEINGTLYAGGGGGGAYASATPGQGGEGGGGDGSNNRAVGKAGTPNTGGGGGGTGGGSGGGGLGSQAVGGSGIVIIRNAR